MEGKAFIILSVLLLLVSLSLAVGEPGPTLLMRIDSVALALLGGACLYLSIRASLAASEQHTVAQSDDEGDDEPRPSSVGQRPREATLFCCCVCGGHQTTNVFFVICGRCRAKVLAKSWQRIHATHTSSSSSSS